MATSLKLIVALLLITISATVSAVSVAPISYPSGIPNISSTPVTFGTVGVPGATAANQTSYLTRIVNLGASGGARGAVSRALLGPWGAVITAAVIAADMALDTDGNIVTLQTVETGVEYVGNCTVPGTGDGYTYGACQAASQAYYANVFQGFCALPTPVIGQVVVMMTLYGQSCVLAIGGFVAASSQPAYEEVTAPISDQAYEDFLEQHLPDILRDIFTDPVTGRPYNDLGTMQDVIQDILSDIAAANDNDPITVPTTDPTTGDTGLETASDQLVDCEFMPTVCAFLEWFKTDVPLLEPPEVPTQDLAGVEQSWSSGFGSGSCPGVIGTTNFQGQLIQYDVTPACTFAGWIRPIVIGSALFTAGFILLGLRSPTA